MALKRLTDISTSTGVTLLDFIHIVNTGDTSQYPSGSSYKATLQQVADSFSGLFTFTGNTSGDCITDLFVSDLNSCSPLHIQNKSNGNVLIGENGNVNVGIGTSTPTATIHGKGIDNTSSNYTLKVDNSTGGTLFNVRNDGLLQINTPTLSYGNLITVKAKDALNDSLVYRDSTDSYDIFKIKGDGYTTARALNIDAPLYPLINFINQYSTWTIERGGYNLSINEGIRERLFMASGGNVGFSLGTTPTARLHVKGVDESSSNYVLKVENSGSTSLLQVVNNGSLQVGKAYNSGFNNTNFIDFVSPSAVSVQQRFSIGFDSKVYVNIDPSNTITGGILHLGSPTFQYYSPAVISRVEVNNYDTTKNIGWIWDNPTGSTHLLSLITTDGSQRKFTLDQSTGNVGIGTGHQKVPSAKLQIEGIDSSSSNYGLKVQNGGGTDNFVVRNDGNVGIGTTSPSTNFQVNQPSVGLISATGVTNSIWPYTGTSFTLVTGVGTLFSDTIKEGDTIQCTGITLTVIYIVSQTALYCIFNPSAVFGTYIGQNPQPFTLTSGQRFNVTSKGNIGIGTTTPSSILDIVHGDRGNYPTMRVRSTNPQLGNKTPFQLSTNNYGSSQLILGNSIADTGSSLIIRGGNSSIHVDSSNNDGGSYYPEIRMTNNQGSNSWTNYINTGSGYAGMSFNCYAGFGIRAASANVKGPGMVIDGYNNTLFGGWRPDSSNQTKFQIIGDAVGTNAFLVSQPYYSPGYLVGSTWYNNVLTVTATTSATTTITGPYSYFTNFLNVGETITVYHKAPPEYTANTSTTLTVTNIDSVNQIRTEFNPIFSGIPITFATGLTYNTQGNTRFIVKNNGNVGIGITNPTSKLNIKTSDTTSLLKLESGTYPYSVGEINHNGTGIALGGLSSYNVTGGYYSRGISVGFNAKTNTVEYGLAIGNDVNVTSSDSAIGVGNSIISSGVLSAAFGNLASATNTNSIMIGNGARFTGYFPIVNNVPNTIAFGLNSDTPTMWITGGNGVIGSTGNVGIGTSTPSEKLEVNGKTKTTTLQVTSNPTDGYVLTSDGSGNATWQQPQDSTSLGTGLTIHFSGKTIFNLPSSPVSGNISGNTTNAKFGMIQKLYHQSAVEPTFPATWKLVGEGVYFTNELNIIYAEYVEPTWIEYWIIQQQ